MEANPDRLSQHDTFDCSETLINGPEAFALTLLANFRDAFERLEAAFVQISDFTLPLV